MDKQKIDQLAKGLLFMSETDAPLIYHEIAVEAAKHWPFAADVQFLELIGERDKRIEPIPPEEFFKQLEVGNDEKSDQIAALRNAIFEELQDIKCYRVGEIQIDIYLLGRAKDKVCGLRTLSVET